MNVRGIFPTLIAVLTVAALAGCASDESASRFLVPPDKYVLYSCPELATASQPIMTRLSELDVLMVKAGSGVANALAYQPEYYQLRGEIDQMRKTATEKNCKPIPGVTGPSIRTSNQAVR